MYHVQPKYQHQDYNVFKRFRAETITGRVSVLAYLVASNLTGHRKPSQTTNLTEAALKEHDATSAVNDHRWAVEERKRVERLQLAAKELGFELPRECFHR